MKLILHIMSIYYFQYCCWHTCMFWICSFCTRSSAVCHTERMDRFEVARWGPSVGGWNQSRGLLGNITIEFIYAITLCDIYFFSLV